MNNYYVLYHLSKKLIATCIGLSFKFSISPHKNVWEAYIGDENKTYRLVFSANSSETALFLDHFREPRTVNITTFFNKLKNRNITDIELAGNDRLITITFSGGYTLLFQVFGNKPNVFLVRDNLIIESFKSPDEVTGTIPPKPRPESKEQNTWKLSLSPKDQILNIDPKFPRHLIPKIIEFQGLDKREPWEIQRIIQLAVDAMLKPLHYRVLHDGNLCLLPEDILPEDNLEVFDEINAAVRFVYYKTSGERRLSAKIQSIKPKIESRIQKLVSAKNQLKQADKGLERAEVYEQYGHILMAHAHVPISGDKTVLELPDFYNENKSIKIPVDNRLSIAENAQKFYEKSSKSLRNVEESRKRMEETENHLNELNEIYHTLVSINKVYEFNNWLKENKSKLLGLGVLSDKKNHQKAPYRKIQLDGYEVWLGRNAKSNDKLTTDAHKEDVWMHARGVSGSHLVIRMNNQKNLPPKSVLLKAASLAAWNSKARGAGLVPVIITKRKYVTKPKGAPPGTVRVQQEKVEMVEPVKYQG